jgi:hypothetical protein
MNTLVYNIIWIFFVVNSSAIAFKAGFNKHKKGSTIERFTETLRLIQNERAIQETQITFIQIWCEKINFIKSDEEFPEYLQPISNTMLKEMISSMDIMQEMVDSSRRFESVIVEELKTLTK